MIFKLSNTDLEILKHIVFVAKKIAKTINFNFIRGKKQYYLTPKKDLLIYFELSKPISFEYPVFDLESFLSYLQRNKSKVIDNTKRVSKKDDLFLPDAELIKDFLKRKLVYKTKFTFEDLQISNSMKVSDFKHLDIATNHKKLNFRYQTYTYSWWETDKSEIFVKEKVIKKFRYVLERKKLRLLPTDYELLLKDKMIVFKTKDYPLEYHFVPDRHFPSRRVRDYFDITPPVEDEHLKDVYRNAGLIK